MTIDYSDTINELKGRIDLCACGHMDAADLIAVAGRSIDIEARAILAQPEYVHMLWGWLEGKRIEIFAKIGSRESGVGSRKSQGIKTAGSNSENSNTTPDSRLPTPDPRMIEEINSILKKGADGAAIKTSTVSLAGLASALFPVRHDLFFGKKLLFDLNLENMGPLSWKDAFFQMKKIKADGIILSSFADKIKEPAVAKAMAGKQGIRKKEEDAFDVVGAVYGMLVDWDDGFGGDLWFEFDSIADIESAHRLVQKMRPDLTDRTRFFIKE